MAFLASKNVSPALHPRHGDAKPLKAGAVNEEEVCMWGECLKLVSTDHSAALSAVTLESTRREWIPSPVPV